jgi:hypothetical protein
MNGDRMTNVGSTKMMGDGTERPGIGSNQIRAMHSLQKSIKSDIKNNGAEDSPERTLSDLAKRDPSISDQTKKEQRHHAKGYISENVHPLHCICSQYVYVFILLL